MAAGAGSHAVRISVFSTERPHRQARHPASESSAACVGSGRVPPPQHNTYQPVQLKILMYVLSFLSLSAFC